MYYLIKIIDKGAVRIYNFFVFEFIFIKLFV